MAGGYLYSMKSWYEIDDIDQLDSPALVVFPERVIYNIDQAIKMAGRASRLRPHVKTNKSPEVCRLMMDRGITKYKCATIAEAEMLGMAGAPDVLFAYPLTGPKINRLVRLIRKFPGTRYSALVDSLETAKTISAVLETEGLVFDVFLDINTGMNRTGMVPGDEAIDLFHFCGRERSLRPVGLHVYDGHIRDEDLVVRKEKCDAAFERAVDLKDRLELENGDKLKMVCGGSPTFPIHAARPEVECSPGTFVYWDAGYGTLFNEPYFLPAAVLVTRVISKPAPGLICTDLGHKAVAAENEIGKRVHFLNSRNLQALGQSEEHLVLKFTDEAGYKIGEVLYALPYHICPTVALYEGVTIVENHRVTGYWRTIARDRKITV